MISKDRKERFAELYSCALKASRNLCIPIEETATKAFGFHNDTKMNMEELYSLFQEEYPKNSETDKANTDRQDPTDIHFLYETWILCGGTGVGKSAFVNYIARENVAEEGSGIFSCTLKSTAHEFKDLSLFVVDPPGLGDTDGSSDKDIMKQIMQEVKSKLEYSSQIRAVFYIWSPTNTKKCDVKRITKKLCKSFGKEILKSLIILVNKNSSKWSEEMDDSVQQLAEAISNDGDLKHIPIIEQDLKKTCGLDSISSLKKLVMKVRPYNEEYFEKHRKELFYQDYCKRVNEDLERSQLTDSITQKLLDSQALKGRKIEIVDVLEKFFRDTGTEIRLARIKKDKTYVERLNEEMRALDKDLNFQNGSLNGVISWISVFIPPLCVVTGIVRLLIIPSIRHALASI